MAVTGCLQESGRGTYILTTLNEPKRPDSSTPKAISKETLAAAEHSYRLSSSRGRELRPLVGKSVHVEGTLVERSDLLKTGEKSNQTAATAGVQSDHKAAGANERITATDLAEIDVAAVQKVANNCGHVAKRPRSKR